MRAQGADAAPGSWRFLGRPLREVAGGSDRRARGAVRERATQAAGPWAQSDAGGWVRRFGRATRVAGEQRRQVGQVCQRRGEGKASADGVCCGTGRRSRVSRPSAGCASGRGERLGRPERETNWAAGRGEKRAGPELSFGFGLGWGLGLPFLF